MPNRTAAPPMPNTRPSCRPAVPPPPVSGAAVGNVGVEECVTGADDAAALGAEVGEVVAGRVVDAGAGVCDASDALA
jgi:hypothetical protein